MCEIITTKIKTMKIDELPVELLMTIFSFLPRIRNFENISLVNKKFYDVAGKLWDQTIRLRLDDWHLVSLFGGEKHPDILSFNFISLKCTNDFNNYPRWTRNVNCCRASSTRIER